MQGNIEAFVKDANSSRLKLSWGSEDYGWETRDNSNAFGFTKIQYSLRQRRDFLRIVEELKRIAQQWPDVRITAADDHVLGEWWRVQNIDVDNLPV